MGTNPSHFKGDELPIECVSFEDCQTFITQLNAITKCKFRFPLDVEWEYAARGGNNQENTKYIGSDDIDSVAWFRYNSDERTHTVGKKKPNSIGLYDMAGNVSEWGIPFKKEEAEYHYADSAALVLGSSYHDGESACKSDYIDTFFASHKASYIGLRLALDI